MYLGIDVGGTKIRGALYDGERLEPSAKIPTPGDYATFLSGVVRLCRGMAVNRKEQLEGVAVGVPGRVSERRVEWVPNLRYLDGRALGRDLSGLVGADVYVANDAQLTLLGESWQGAAKHSESAALISVGTGVGGAIMFGNKVVRGANASAGAFGWVNLDPNQPGDPNHGYLELNASGTALEGIGRRLEPPATPHEMMERARSGEMPYAKVVRRVARMLGVSSAAIASILDPEVVIFSGGLSDAFDVMSGTIRAAFREFASPSVANTPITVAELGSEAALYGAVRAAMLRESAWE